MLVFLEEGKPENPEENPPSKARTNKLLNPHDNGSESNPGHIGGRQALSPLATQNVRQLSLNHI